MMSRTNYEAVSDYVGHWLHRAQVSLLTGAIGQIKLNHIRKKKPGAGLVRAWCGPGAGLARAPRPKPRSRPRSKTEAAEPASLQDRSRGAGLAFKVTHGL